MKANSIFNLLAIKALVLGIFVSTTFAPIAPATAATLDSPSSTLVCYIVTTTRTEYSLNPRTKQVSVNKKYKHEQSHSMTIHGTNSEEQDKTAAAQRDANSRYAGLTQFRRKTHSNIQVRVVPCDSAEYKKFKRAVDTVLGSDTDTLGLLQIEDMRSPLQF